MEPNLCSLYLSSHNLSAALVGGPRGAADELALLLDGEGVNEVEGAVVCAGQLVVQCGGQPVEFLEFLAGLQVCPVGEDLCLRHRVPAVEGPEGARVGLLPLLLVVLSHLQQVQAELA